MDKRLEEGVRRAFFREDLLCRIAVVALAVPALRERVHDIALLINHTLAEFGQENPQGIGHGSQDPEDLPDDFGCKKAARLRPPNLRVEATASPHEDTRLPERGRKERWVAAAGGPAPWGSSRRPSTENSRSSVSNRYNQSHSSASSVRSVLAGGVEPVAIQPGAPGTQAFCQSHLLASQKSLQEACHLGRDKGLEPESWMKMAIGLGLLRRIVQLAPCLKGKPRGKAVPAIRQVSQKWRPPLSLQQERRI